MVSSRSRSVLSITRMMNWPAEGDSEWWPFPLVKVPPAQLRSLTGLCTTSMRAPQKTNCPVSRSHFPSPILISFSIQTQGVHSTTLDRVPLHLGLTTALWNWNYSLPLNNSGVREPDLHTVENLRVTFDSPKTSVFPQYPQGTDSRTPAIIKIRRCLST